MSQITVNLNGLKLFKIRPCQCWTAFTAFTNDTPYPLEILHKREEIDSPCVNMKCDYYKNWKKL